MSFTTTPVSNKRIVTSAIDGISVAEVRRGLDNMRRLWKTRSDSQPFFLSEMLFNGMNVQEFAFQFVMGHHHKRHNKSKRTASVSTSESFIDNVNLQKHDIRVRRKRASIN